MASKNLKQLDVQNLYLLNMPSKLLLAGLLIVGMLALGYVGVFKDQIETLNTQEAKEDELKETFTRKSIQAASLNNLKAELASIRSAFDVFVETIADRRGNSEPDSRIASGRFDQRLAFGQRCTAPT